MQTNNHFKKSIREMNNFISNNTQPPQDLAFNFISELRVSNLLIPVALEAANASFPHLENDDGSNLLPLFTDMDEFAKYSSDFTPLPNELAFYRELVERMELNGIIVNPMGDNFYVDRQLLEQLPPLPENLSDEGMDAQKLKELGEETSNVELRSYIRDEDNLNNFTDIPLLLKKSVLLNVVAGDETFRDDTVNGDETGGFVLSTVKSGKEVYCPLFTDVDAIRKTSDKNQNYYFQVVNYIEVFKYILSSDMEGIVINPGLEEFYIPRNQVMALIEDGDLINRDLSNASNYAFRI